MQTFLPYDSFVQSAKCLDMRRLGKQRVEAMQILQALNGKTKGWKNHPATLMWKGFEESLVFYSIEICNEWISRGYRDSCKEKILSMFPSLNEKIVYPSWFGNKQFHDSHKSNLLRKDPEFYGKFLWNVPNDIPYVWPSLI